MATEVKAPFAPGGVAAIDAQIAQRLLSIALERGGDYADLYFQYSRSEGWSLEEGIVKSGSFSIDQGVGVRAIAGEKTAFAYSDEISLPALQDAARATRAIAANEAEKAAEVHLLEVITFGAFGRLWLGGWEAEIAESAKAVESVLQSIQGRENKG